MGVDNFNNSLLPGISYLRPGGPDVTVTQQKLFYDEKRMGMHLNFLYFKRILIKMTGFN